MEKYISLRKAQQKKETEKTGDFDGKEKTEKREFCCSLKRFFFCTEFDMKKHRDNKDTNKMKFERERKVNETRKQEETKKRENRWKEDEQQEEIKRKRSHFRRTT